MREYQLNMYAKEKMFADVKKYWKLTLPERSIPPSEIRLQ